MDEQKKTIIKLEGAVEVIEGRMGSIEGKLDMILAALPKNNIVVTNDPMEVECTGNVDHNSPNTDMNMLTNES